MLCRVKLKFDRANHRKNKGKVILKRIYISFLILLFSSNLQTYSQTLCQQNTKVCFSVGSVEDYIYKQYPDKKGKQLHLAVTRPADNLPDKKRPLIIGVHSGGFLDFCPLQPCYLKYSENVLAENFVP